MRPPSHARRAFTLVELLAVLGIMLLMAGVVVPAMSSLSRANELSNASRLVSNMLTIARTEAVTKRMKMRFAVVRNWQDQPDANFRKMSIWKQESDQADWVQITKWEQVPQGVVFDTNPTLDSPAALSGNLLSDTEANAFSATVNGKNVDLQYAEFYPNGSASMPAMTGFDIWLVLSATTPSTDEASSNWAKITTSALTGRVKVERP